ncbi:MAG: hypothetical protein ABIP54_02970 [Candidatus Andersenbacteria bacterium]
MTFIASRLFGLLIILVAIGVIVVLWVQCGSNGCSFTAVVKPSPSPIITDSNEFGTPEIRIAKLIQGSEISSPVVIQGKAIPDWYIGGKFTVRVLDGSGHGLAYAQATPTATTASNGFIPFQAVLAFFPSTPDGTVLFEKNLGSGLPNFPSTIALPVKFTNYIAITPTPVPTMIETATPTPVPSATPVTTGVLQGAMTINISRPSVKMFAQRVISVYEADKTTLVIKIVPGADGRFAQELPAGNYYVDMIPQILGSITGVPTSVTITPGKTTTLNIAVDTGIQTPENTITDTQPSDGF